MSFDPALNWNPELFQVPPQAPFIAQDSYCSYHPNYIPTQAHNSSIATVNPSSVQDSVPLGQRPALRGENANIEEFLTLIPQKFITSLCRVFSTDWWANNELEPNRELEEFVHRLPNNRFGCIVGNCDKTYSTRQRALNHFRKEIDHGPYRCSQACLDPACTLRFYSRGNWLSHINRNKMIKCNNCGKVVGERNFRRHTTSDACIRASQAASL